MKCTWSTRPILNLLTLVNLGVELHPQGFLDTNMLVWVTQNCRVGGLNQRKASKLVVRVAVEYRLMYTNTKHQLSLYFSYYSLKAVAIDIYFMSVNHVIESIYGALDGGPPNITCRF